MKKTVKLISLFLCIVLALGGLSACGKTTEPVTKPAVETDPTEKASPAVETKVFRLGHVVADGSAPDIGDKKFAELLEEYSGGSMKVEIYSSGTLGQNRELMEMLQTGALDFTHPTASVISGFIDEAKILDLPYLFSSKEQAESVLTGEIGQSILDALQSVNIVGLGWYSQGWRNTTANVEIHTPADFAGIKIRTQDNAMHLDAFNAMGASAIPMAFSEVYSGLQQHTIDAQENPYTNIYLNGYYEVQDYVIETQHVYDCIGFMMSKVTFDKLTAEEQEIIRKAAAEACAFEREYVFEKDAESKQAIIDSGKCAIVELTDEERDAFREAIQSVYDKYADVVGAENLAKIMAMK